VLSLKFDIYSFMKHNTDHDTLQSGIDMSNLFEVAYHCWFW